MDTFQYQMPPATCIIAEPLAARNPLLGRGTPREEHNSFLPFLSNRLEDLLGEALPTSVLMAEGLVSSHSETSIEQEQARVGPGRQESAVLRRWAEGRVVALDRLVDVLERRRGGCWRPHGETETVGLIWAMVRILAHHDGTDGVQGSMSRPMMHVRIRRLFCDKAHSSIKASLFDRVPLQHGVLYAGDNGARSTMTYQE